MCELFGAAGTYARDLGRWLVPFRARGGETAGNPDGWGVAAWTSGVMQIEKAPEPGASSTRLAWLAQNLRAQIVIAHVRKARHPPVPGLHNTHPFAHTCCGREWVFAHNGLVPDIIGVQTQPDFCRPRGETDSEHAFCHLLAQIAGCYQGATNGDWMRRLAQLAGSVAALGKFNFLLSDGVLLIAYGHDRLHYLENPAGCDDLALVSTEPITGEPWHAFGRGELRVYRGGILALQVTSASEEAAVCGGDAFAPS